METKDRSTQRTACTAKAKFMLYDEAFKSHKNRSNSRKRARPAHAIQP